MNLNMDIINFTSFEFSSNFLLAINCIIKNRIIVKSYSPLNKIFVNKSTFSFRSYFKSYSSGINFINSKIFFLIFALSVKS